MNLCYEIDGFAKLNGLKMSHPLFVRLDLSQPYPPDGAFKNGEQVMPVLFLPRLTTEQACVDAHRDYAQHLFAHGIKKCVIAADEDGALQKSLSPRFTSGAITSRMSLLIQIFTAVKDIMDDVWILLTVEELAPGGFDATDGITVANTLTELGLKTIIATTGTKDFMPLYDRRVTRQKGVGVAEFHSGEPALASSLWLTKNTNLSVWCLAFLDDDEKALDLAKTLGLDGLIKKEKYDSI